MPIHYIVLLIIAVPVSLGMAYLTFSLLRSNWLSYQNKATVLDVFVPVAEASSLNEPCAEAETKLLALGFEVIAVNKVQLVWEKIPHYSRWYAHNGEIIGATLSPQEGLPLAPYLVYFVTDFTDESIIETRYPIGENIVTPDLISRHSRKSIEIAFDYHAEKVNEWVLQGKTPHPFHTSDDIQKHEATYNRRHKTRVFRRLWLSNILQAFLRFTVAAAGCAIIVVILRQEDHLLASWVQFALISFFFMLAQGAATLTSAEPIEKPDDTDSEE